ncbi:amino acid synthesis family protein [Agrobacterium vitis]|uniref:Amino acid synthesis family protein n=1 Tax=Agrobacterium vitis TaxID=373 RepID=A0AAE2UTA2_AGRVI|nr:amino acid synthesis family protein [Agrobacterium vitis]MBF2714091.1 amino acid synthesis family protein [Agrobacterium vitis]MUO82408.1 amino acid synthesis family protein [Agrobacterium vitis]MUO95883.1 amino acid synthesis family protein [Agrobacterium vitis]MVA93962.1 amino acid synthesis family protein [Agrobacterium vitis]MVB03531.1 amino acid synthesis family protein [Agrobacterium vitis]
MELNIRRMLTVKDDAYDDGVTRVERPLRKVAVIFVVANPLAGTRGANVQGLIDVSPKLGEMMGRKLVEAMGEFEIQGYGKGGLVGLGGEQEHANALLTTAFANPLRSQIGGGEAWISSYQKVVAPNAVIDIPMNHKDEIYVRSHYDGMTLTVPNGPQYDEIAIIFCAASRGRLSARVGGLTHEEVLTRKMAVQASREGAT